MILIPLSSQAQELVELKNFNVELFNQYVLQEVNKLRVRNRVDTLVPDPSLDQAGQDHADYMAENKQLTHFQKKNKLKVRPYDRVQYYGGTHDKVAENIQLVPLEFKIEKSKNRLTYEKLAKEIVDTWKKSSDHYRNMMNPNYAGVSHTYALKDGILYCCQVLASKPFDEAYNFQKGSVLHVKDKKPCGNCKRYQKKVNKDQGHLGWYTVSNDSVYYHNTDVLAGPNNKVRKGNIKRLFKANGAIAVDVIHQEQFNCSGIPSYHNSLYHDGYYIGYISKAKLKYDLDPTPHGVTIFAGMLPAFRDTFYQVDFNLVKKWRPCMTGMTIYVNPDYLQPQEYFTIPKPVVGDGSISVFDSVDVTIPFESGQTDEDTSIFHPLITMLDSLEQESYKIRSIYFDGVASIEGTKQGNELLFKRRGEIIADYLCCYYPNYKLESEFYEDFEDFQSGLVSMGIKDAINWDEDELRRYANAHAREWRIANLLDDTRTSFIKIVYEDAIPLERGGYSLSVKRIQDLIDFKDHRQAEPLYKLLANQIIEGDYDKKDSLLSLKIPETKAFAKLNWYDFVLRLSVDNEPVAEEKLTHLMDIEAIPRDWEFLEYRLMFNIFNGNENINVDDFAEVHSEIRVKRQKAWVEALELIMGVENFRYSDAMAAPILVNLALKKKFDVKKTYFICQYLIKWGYSVEPYILLSKFARRSGQIPKLYKQYLKLAYFLGQFEKKKEWKKIRRVFFVLADNHPEEFCDLFKWHQMGVRALDVPDIAELFCDKCRE